MAGSPEVSLTLILEQIRHQLRGRTAEDAPNEVLGRAPLDLFLRDLGKENKVRSSTLCPIAPVASSFRNNVCAVL